MAGRNPRGYDKNVAEDAYMITPDDGADVSPRVKAILVGTGGDLSVVTEVGESRVWTVPSGVTVMCGVKRVLATGTTASDLLGYV